MEEDSSWAQTFITVTPQEDGYLREINETSTVSGNADVPLNLDTWNIVQRRSLENNTKNFIDPGELEKNERIAIECQTYLQGVPKVNLPLIYRDEATQTLYIGKHERNCFSQTIDHVINVMNEKPLPVWKKSRYVQTKITFENEDLPLSDVTKKLENNTTEWDNEISESTTPSSETEISDIMNFLIERAFWISGPISSTRPIMIDAEVETLLKFNYWTKKLTTDIEAQTNLSCKPKDSNTMLLSDYNEIKNICKEQIEGCFEKGIYPKIVAENVMEEIVKKSERQVYFPLIENKVECENLKDEKKIIIDNRIDYRPECPRKKCHRFSPRALEERTLKTKNILLVDNHPYVVKNYNEGAQDLDLKLACDKQKTDWSRNSFSTTSFSGSEESSSFREDGNGFLEPKKSLAPRDEKALNVLKKTLCRNSLCPRKATITAEEYTRKELRFKRINDED